MATCQDCKTNDDVYLDQHLHPFFFRILPEPAGRVEEAGLQQQQQGDPLKTSSKVVVAWQNFGYNCKINKKTVYGKTNDFLNEGIHSIY